MRKYLLVDCCEHDAKLLRGRLALRDMVMGEPCHECSHVPTVTELAVPEDVSQLLGRAASYADDAAFRAGWRAEEIDSAREPGRYSEDERKAARTAKDTATDLRALAARFADLQREKEEAERQLRDVREINLGLDQQRIDHKNEGIRLRKRLAELEKQTRLVCEMPDLQKGGRLKQETLDALCIRLDADLPEGQTSDAAHTIRGLHGAAIWYERKVRELQREIEELEWRVKYLGGDKIDWETVECVRAEAEGGEE